MINVVTSIQLTEEQAIQLAKRLDIIRKVLLSQQVQWTIGSGDWDLTEAEEHILLNIIRSWGE
jgi:hypothetical protein